jgi:hypothetical protein
VHAGIVPYEGTMTKGDQIIKSSIYGSGESLVSRSRDDP